MWLQQQYVLERPLRNRKLISTSPALSPWTALEYCVDPPGVENTWVCHAPESCGCEWPAGSEDMLILQPRGCQDMGSDARVALYAPSALAPYVSLPTSIGGSTGYFSPTVLNHSSTWVTTAIPGYTPSPITQLTTYGIQPTNVVQVNPRAKPSPSTVAAAVSVTATGDPTASTTPNTGLSTAAKAGIGAGIGGGALVVALIVLTVLLCRKRRSKPQPSQNDPIPYTIGPPMQTSSPYMTQAEKDSWHAATYSAGSSPPILSPHFEPTYQTQYSHVVPSLYSEQRSAKAPSISPPTELSAERHVHELQTERPRRESNVSRISSDKK